MQASERAAADTRSFHSATFRISSEALAGSKRMANSFCALAAAVVAMTKRGVGGHLKIVVNSTVRHAFRPPKSPHTRSPRRLRPRPRKPRALRLTRQRRARPPPRSAPRRAARKSARAAARAVMSAARCFWSWSRVLTKSTSEISCRIVGHVLPPNDTLHGCAAVELDEVRNGSYLSKTARARLPEN